MYHGRQIDVVSGKITPEKGLAKRVVLDLVAPFAGLNHVVYCDNFYSSVPLADTGQMKEKISVSRRVIFKQGALITSDFMKTLLALMFQSTSCWEIPYTPFLAIFQSGQSARLLRETLKKEDELGSWKRAVTGYVANMWLA